MADIYHAKIEYVGTTTKKNWLSVLTGAVLQSTMAWLTQETQFPQTLEINMTKTTSNAKTRLLTYLSKESNTLTVAQARARFKIANPTARIADLRKEGHNIVTTMRTGRDGIERAVYSLMPAARKGVRRTVKA
jgi:hypothetical protein